MSRELLPCPFCNAAPAVYSDRHRTWGLVEHNEGCLFPAWPKHEISEQDFEAWNTRAEPTCEMVDIPDGWETQTAQSWPDGWVCDTCGVYTYGISTQPDRIDIPNYCPNCGCKVVD